MTPSPQTKIIQQIEQAIATLSVGQLALGYIRYEKLRLLNPRQYKELSSRHLNGALGQGLAHIPFDSLVDELPGPG